MEIKRNKRKEYVMIIARLINVGIAKANKTVRVKYWVDLRKNIEKYLFTERFDILMSQKDYMCRIVVGNKVVGSIKIIRDESNKI